MVLYGTDTTYLLSMTNTGLVNTQDGSVVVDAVDAYNYWNVLWPCDPADDSYFDPIASTGGIWVKTIYNEYSGHIQSKAWDIDLEDFDLCDEQCGWVVDNRTNPVTSEYVFIQQDTAQCFGLVVWNPADIQLTATLNG